MPELEVWLIGTPTQLDAAVNALTTTGRHVLPADPHHHPKRTPLAGVDRGRYRLYLRIAVADHTTRPSPRAAAPRRAATTGQSVVDLDDYRRSA